MNWTVHRGRNKPTSKELLQEKLLRRRLIKEMRAIILGSESVPCYDPSLNEKVGPLRRKHTRASLLVMIKAIAAMQPWLHHSSTGPFLGRYLIWLLYTHNSSTFVLIGRESYESISSTCVHVCLSLLAMEFFILIISQKMQGWGVWESIIYQLMNNVWTGDVLRMTRRRKCISFI